MTYTQIKNLLIPPAKRTAVTVQKLIAKMPNLPVWPKLMAQIGLAVLTTNLTAIIVMGVLMPPGVASWAALVAALMVFLSAYQLYESREAIAKAIVMILYAL